MRSIALVALVLSASPVLAESTQASGTQAVKASAALDFRIVIPETLHVDSQSERRARSQAFVSRTTQALDGRVMVTVARP
jgi:hypothetical protein